MTLSISRKILMLVAVPVLFEVALVGVLTTLVKRVESARNSESHARELGAHLNAIMILHLRRVSLLMLGKASTSDAMLGEADRCRDKMHQECGIVERLVADDPEERTNWGKVTALAASIDDGFASAREEFDKGNKIVATMKWSKVTKDIDLMFRMSQQLSAEQARLQQERSVELQQYDEQLQKIIYLSVVGSILIAFGLATYFNKGTTARLEVLMENTKNLAMGRPPGKALTGEDELAQIDLLFHDMYRDLTTLRHKERAILDSAAEVICSIDQNFSFTDVNNAATKMWSYTQEELMGRRIVELIEESDKATISAKLQEAIAKESEVRFETRMIRGDGTIIDTAWSVTWSDAERSLYCVIHDISQRKQLEQMKRDFVDMISHDLRTPLSSVLASVELVALPAFELTAEGHLHLSKAEKNLLRALTLINQLLEMERIEAGMITLVRADTNTKDLTDSAIGAVSDLAATKNITIESDESNLKLTADADRVVQVLINLLGNALKFSESGTKIVVTTEIAGNFVRFNVTDQGRGIPDEEKQRVFERFQQVSPRSKTERSGSGLGLAICKAIIEAHGGSIGVISAVGEGSTFWFEILQAPISKH